MDRYMWDIPSDGSLSKTKKNNFWWIATFIWFRDFMCPGWVGTCIHRMGHLLWAYPVQDDPRNCSRWKQFGNCTEFLDTVSLSRNTVSQNFQSASTIYFKQCFYHVSWLLGEWFFFPFCRRQDSECSTCVSSCKAQQCWNQRLDFSTQPWTFLARPLALPVTVKSVQ